MLFAVSNFDFINIILFQKISSGSEQESGTNSEDLCANKERKFTSVHRRQRMLLALHPPPHPPLPPSLARSPPDEILPWLPNKEGTDVMAAYG